jgi:hypothetical protein
VVDEVPFRCLGEEGPHAAIMGRPGGVAIDLD